MAVVDNRLRNMPRPSGPGPVVTQSQVLQGYVSPFAGAYKRPHKRPGGWKGFVARAFENPVLKYGVLKPLEVLDTGRRAVISTVREVTDVLDSDPNTNASWSDWTKQTTDTSYGFGKAFPMKGWLGRAIGFVGDVGLDPLTYVTFGGSALVKGVGGKAIHVAGAEGRRALATKVASTIMERAGAEADDVARAAIQSTAKTALRDVSAQGVRAARKVLTAEEVAKVGLGKAGVYFFGKRLPALRVPFSAPIGEAAESALSRLRLAASSVKPLGWLGEKATPKILREERVALARGTLSPEVAWDRMSRIYTVEAMNATRATALREVGDLLNATVRESGVQADEALRRDLHLLLEGGRAPATAAETAAVERWNAFYKELWDKQDALLGKLDPTGRFGKVDRYLPHELTDDARKWLTGADPNAAALRDVLTSDALGTTSFFNPRRLTEGREFFGQPLKEGETTVAEINRIARERGGLGFDFFETDAAKLAVSYSQSWAEQMGRIGGVAELVNQGLVSRQVRRAGQDTEAILEATKNARAAMSANEKALRQASRISREAAVESRKAVDDISKRAAAAGDNVAALSATRDASITKAAATLEKQREALVAARKVAEVDRAAVDLARSVSDDAARALEDAGAAAARQLDAMIEHTDEMIRLLNGGSTIDNLLEGAATSGEALRLAESKLRVASHRHSRLVEQQRAMLEFSNWFGGEIERSLNADLHQFTGGLMNLFGGKSSADEIMGNYLKVQARTDEITARLRSTREAKSPEILAERAELQKELRKLKRQLKDAGRLVQARDAAMDAVRNPNAADAFSDRYASAIGAAMRDPNSAMGRIFGGYKVSDIVHDSGVLPAVVEVKKKEWLSLAEVFGGQSRASEQAALAAAGETAAQTPRYRFPIKVVKAMKLADNAAALDAAMTGTAKSSDIVMASGVQAGRVAHHFGGEANIPDVLRQAFDRSVEASEKLAKFDQFERAAARAAKMRGPNYWQGKARKWGTLAGQLEEDLGRWSKLDETLARHETQLARIDIRISERAEQGRSTARLYEIRERILNDMDGVQSQMHRLETKSYNLGTRMPIETTGTLSDFGSAVSVERGTSGYAVSELSIADRTRQARRRGVKPEDTMNVVAESVRTDLEYGANLTISLQEALDIERRNAFGKLSGQQTINDVDRPVHDALMGDEWYSSMVHSEEALTDLLELRRAQGASEESLKKIQSTLDAARSTRERRVVDLEKKFNRALSDKQRKYGLFADEAANVKGPQELRESVTNMQAALPFSEAADAWSQLDPALLGRSRVAAAREAQEAAEGLRTQFEAAARWEKLTEEFAKFGLVPPENLLDDVIEGVRLRRGQFWGEQVAAAQKAYDGAARIASEGKWRAVFSKDAATPAELMSAWDGFKTELRAAVGDDAARHLSGSIEGDGVAARYVEQWDELDQTLRANKAKAKAGDLEAHEKWTAAKEEFDALRERADAWYRDKFGFGKYGNSYSKEEVYGFLKARSSFGLSTPDELREAVGRAVSDVNDELLRVRRTAKRSTDALSDGTAVMGAHGAALRAAEKRVANARAVEKSAAATVRRRQRAIEIIGREWEGSTPHLMAQNAMEALTEARADAATLLAQRRKSISEFLDMMAGTDGWKLTREDWAALGLTERVPHSQSSAAQINRTINGYPEIRPSAMTPTDNYLMGVYYRDHNLKWVRVTDAEQVPAGAELFSVEFGPPRQVTADELANEAATAFPTPSQDKAIVDSGSGYGRYRTAPDTTPMRDRALDPKSPGYNVHSVAANIDQMYRERGLIPPNLESSRGSIESFDGGVRKRIPSAGDDTVWLRADPVVGPDGKQVFVPVGRAPVTREGRSLVFSQDEWESLFTPERWAVANGSEALERSVEASKRVQQLVVERDGWVRQREMWNKVLEGAPKKRSAAIQAQAERANKRVVLLDAEIAESRQLSAQADRALMSMSRDVRDSAWAKLSDMWGAREAFTPGQSKLFEKWRAVTPKLEHVTSDSKLAATRRQLAVDAFESSKAGQTLRLQRELEDELSKLLGYAPPESWQAEELLARVQHRFNTAKDNWVHYSPEVDNAFKRAELGREQVVVAKNAAGEKVTVPARSLVGLKGSLETAEGQLKDAQARLRAELLRADERGLVGKVKGVPSDAEIAARAEAKDTAKSARNAAAKTAEADAKAAERAVEQYAFLLKAADAVAVDSQKAIGELEKAARLADQALAKAEVKAVKSRGVRDVAADKWYKAETKFNQSRAVSPELAAAAETQAQLAAASDVVERVLGGVRERVEAAAAGKAFAGKDAARLRKLMEKAEVARQELADGFRISQGKRVAVTDARRMQLDAIIEAGDEAAAKFAAARLSDMESVSLNAAYQDLVAALNSSTDPAAKAALEARVTSGQQAAARLAQDDALRRSQAILAGSPAPTAAGTPPPAAAAGVPDTVAGQIGSFFADAGNAIGDATRQVVDRNANIRRMAGEYAASQGLDAAAVDVFKFGPDVVRFKINGQVMEVKLRTLERQFGQTAAAVPTPAAAAAAPAAAAAASTAPVANLLSDVERAALQVAVDDGIAASKLAARHAAIEPKNLERLNAVTAAAAQAETDLILSGQRLAAAEEALFNAKNIQKWTEEVRDGFASLKEWGMPGLEAPIAIKEFYENFQRLQKPLIAQEMERWLGWYTKRFKAYATASPGFHIRNALSNTFAVFAAGGNIENMYRGTKLYEAWLTARKTSGGEQHWLNTLTRKERDLFERAVRVLDAAGGGQQLEALAGVKVGRRFIDNNMYLRAMRRTAERVEGSARFMLAFDSVAKGMDFDMALARVRRHLFDYSAAGRSELDDVMSQIVPFWTWMSRNLPLQIVNRWTNPRAYAMYNSFMRNIAAGDNSQAPEWMRQQGAVNIGGGGYLTPDLGFNRVGEQLQMLGDPARMLSDVNPLLRVPLELQGGRRFYNDSPFSKKPQEVVGGPAQPLVQALLGLIGQTDPVNQGGMGLPVGSTATSAKANYALMNLLPPLAMLERLAPSTAQYQDRQGNSWLGWLGVPYRHLSQKELQAELQRKLREQRGR